MPDPTSQTDASLSRPALLAGDLANLHPVDMASVGFLAGYSGRTRDTYCADLNAFLRWCNDNRLDPLTAQRAHLEFYLRWMAEVRHLAPATQARRFTTVAMWFKWLYYEDLIPKNPAERVKRPTVHREAQYRTWLSALEFAAIYKAAKELGPTEQAVIGLLGVLGLRVNELCTADVEDLGGPSGFEWLRIIGKGGVPATMGLPADVSFAVRQAVGDRSRGPLLLNSWGNRLDRRACQRTIDRCRDRAGVTRPCSPHGLRRSCATILLDSGVGLREVQHQLRHVDPRTTAIYDVGSRNPAGQASHALSAFVGRMVGG